MGWRGTFSGQVPLAVLSIVLIAITMPPRVQQDPNDISSRAKLARVDFLGAVTLNSTIVSLLVPLTIGGDRVVWNSPTIPVFFAGAAVFGALFLATEAWLANEPIVLLVLLGHRDVIFSVSVMVTQAAAQVGLMFAIPLDFQATAGARNIMAGAHLIPAVAGDAIEGILSGAIVKRTGRYKELILLVTVSSSGAYLLLILRWRGKTNWLEALYIFPGGLSTGIVQSLFGIVYWWSKHFATKCSQAGPGFSTF